VDANLQALGVPPDPELLAQVRAIIAPAADVSWKEGLPENDDPGAVEKQQ